MLWLNEVPMCVVNAHLAMLGPLMAEESRTSATVVGVGHAMKPGQWASRQIDAWDSAARNRGEKRGLPVPTGSGIKVIRHG